MARIMTSKYDANCKDCGAFLPAGSQIRYYGRGKVYGTECHDKEGAHDGWDRQTQANGNGNRPRALSEEEMESWPEGRIASHYDPSGAYAPDGTRLSMRVNPNGRCEDAPCCGCCD